MAWLVVIERVPNLDEWHRLSAEIQSVYVTADLRGSGIGRRMIDELFAETDRRAVGRVSVHSGRRAIEFYERLGFAGSPQLMARERR
jgi:ribosomal protein S18 acetylase RimI-like enzyme